MQKELNSGTMNKALVRVLFVSLIIFAGMLYETYASTFTGLSGLTISGDLTVTTTLTLNTTEGSVPKGALIFWDGANCPAGWTLVSTYNDRFPVGGATVATGGSDTHTHTSTHGHTSSMTLDAATHTHAQTLTESAAGTNHGMTTCGPTTDYNPFTGVTFYTGSDVTDTDSHTHFGSDYRSNDDAGSHSHSITGTLPASGASSSSTSKVPLYNTLKLCSKW